MSPVHFTGVTNVLGKPQGWDDDVHGPCDGLPVMVREGVCISSWKLTWKERIAVLCGRNIWVHVVSGATQPPIALMVQ